MNARKNRYYWLTLAAAAFCALALTATPALAQQAGDCVTVHVQSTVVLPDGSEHDAGSLRICYTQAFSPVSGLHKMSVDGEAVGMLRSKRGTSEGESERNIYVLFQRVASDKLMLIGYAWPERGAMTTYRFSNPVQPDGSTMALSRKELRTGSLFAGFGNGSEVLLAARND